MSNKTKKNPSYTQSVIFQNYHFYFLFFNFSCTFRLSLPLHGNWSALCRCLTGRHSHPLRSPISHSFPFSSLFLSLSFPFHITTATPTTTNDPLLASHRRPNRAALCRRHHRQQLIALSGRQPHPLSFSFPYFFLFPHHHRHHCQRPTAAATYHRWRLVLPSRCP